MNISYSYNTIHSSGDYLSIYALVYLRNKFSVSIHHKIFKNLSAGWAYSFISRAGSYEDATLTNRVYTPYSLLDGKINYHIKQFNIFIEASNILNKAFIDIGDVEMPGRWAKAGIIFNLDY